MREYAERNGITQITWDMQGDQMKSILVGMGVKDLGLPYVQLGTRHVMQQAAPIKDPNVAEISLEEMQKQQWEQQAKQKLLKTETRAELAKECKRRGIKMARTDTKEQLIEKLSGQSHAA